MKALYSIVIVLFLLNLAPTRAQSQNLLPTCEVGRYTKAYPADETMEYDFIGFISSTGPDKIVYGPFTSADLGGLPLNIKSCRELLPTISGNFEATLVLWNLGSREMAHVSRILGVLVIVAQYHWITDQTLPTFPLWMPVRTCVLMQDGGLYQWSSVITNNDLNQIGTHPGKFRVNCIRREYRDNPLGVFVPQETWCR